MKHIVIIGAGAAGMMAAIAATGDNTQVTLLEKNEKTGKKIFITGKGRCNITNACETEKFFENIISNPKFMYSAFYQMDNQAVIRFFEENGCKCKEERGERIFPVSDHSSDVIAALNRQMAKKQVDVRLNTEVKSLLTEVDEAGKDKITGVLLNDKTVIKADAVIVTTGGKSYEATGSTGDGYKWAQELGHTIKEVKPALVPLVVEENWCKEMQGLSLKNVAVILSNGKKKIYEGFGEMLFTHFGVSGPLILSASSHYVKKYKDVPVTLTIDLKPALTKEQLDKRLLRDFEENKNKQFKNSLDGLLPSKMIPVIIRLSGILPDKKVNEITREERSILIDLLKNLTMTVVGARGFREAIVTQGGVHVKEINPSTMESKIVNGLYFAGEVLDLDAVTGGFNLQIAWSTGFLAGSCAAQNG